MKKFFFSIMLAAAVATGLMSCNKTTSLSDTHTQKYTLGETSYDINNAFAIENIKDSIGQIYNVIMLSQTEEVGFFGNKTKGVFIVFEGDFASGTYNLAYDPEHPLDHFPMYLVGENEVDNIIHFSLSSFLNQADAFIATSGSFTLTIYEDLFTVTGTGIEVEKLKDQTQVSTSSVDFEDHMLNFVLSDVVEGNFNDTDAILTAGMSNLNILGTPTGVVAFVTEKGDVVGFTSSTSFGDEIPADTYSNADNPIIYLQDMSITSLKFASSGEITVAKDGDNYTIDMTGVDISGISGTSTLHYIGTMPKFDLSFLKE